MLIGIALSALSISVSCGGSTPSVDAAKSADAAKVDAAKVDAPGSGSNEGLAFGSDCTVVSDDSTECASGVCTNTFNMFPTPVCSQKCTDLGGSDATCPTGSMGKKCNQQGYCRP